MGSRNQHLESAQAARSAAEMLHDSQPAWALVPLFYSAMHILHALLADRGTSDLHHPTGHHSRRDADGQVTKWGTLDVVVLEFPSPIVTAYRELHKVSELVRYKHVNALGDTKRFWAYAAQIQALIE